MDHNQLEKYIYIVAPKTMLMRSRVLTNGVRTTVLTANSGYGRSILGKCGKASVKDIRKLQYRYRSHVGYAHIFGIRLDGLMQCELDVLERLVFTYLDNMRWSCTSMQTQLHLNEEHVDAFVNDIKTTVGTTHGFVTSDASSKRKRNNIRQNGNKDLQLLLGFHKPTTKPEGEFFKLGHGNPAKDRISNILKFVICGANYIVQDIPERYKFCSAIDNHDLLFIGLMLLLQR